MTMIAKLSTTILSHIVFPCHIGRSLLYVNIYIVAKSGDRSALTDTPIRVF